MPADQSLGELALCQFQCQLSGHRQPIGRGRMLRGPIYAKRKNRNDTAKKSRVATSALQTHHDTISDLPCVDSFADRDKLTSSVRARNDLHHVILYRLIVTSMTDVRYHPRVGSFEDLQKESKSAIPITSRHATPAITSLKLRDTALILTRTSPWPGFGVFTSFASWSESIPSPFGMK